MYHQKVLFTTDQLFGTAANLWERYCNSHANVDSITWNQFKARFRSHYVPHGTMKLKKKEFVDMKQGNMTVNEYLNSFIQLLRYATEDINTDEKKQDMFLNGLNDDIQFQLLNTDYAHFQHMVDKAIVIENKIKKMEKDDKRKMPFHGQSSYRCFYAPARYRVVKIVCSYSEVVLQTMKNYKAHYSLFWFRPLL
jgi:hypothetical protein